jgi:hypothetical protein
MFLEIRHDVSDRRGGKAEAGLPGQGARADRLAVAHIAFHQRAQELLRPVIRLAVAITRLRQA